MNAKTIVLFVLFLCFGFVAKAGEYRSADTKIPGGIIRSNGKDAIFLEFKTGRKINLTAGWKDVVFKPPFAASENGKHLVWFQDSKFYTMDLPLGAPRTVQAVTFKWQGNANKATGVRDKDIDLVWNREVKNLSMSPDGLRFTFEASHTAPGWTLLDPGNPQVFARMLAIGAYNSPNPNDLAFKALPLYVKKNDSFNGISYLSIRMNQYDPRTESDPFSPIFGSVVEHPPVGPFKATCQDLRVPVTPNSILRPLGYGLYGILSIGGEISNGRFGGSAPRSGKIDDSITVKKNARHLTFQKCEAWEKGMRKAAFIYQIGNQWGPIEIQTLDSKNQYGKDYSNNKNISLLSAGAIPEEYRSGKAREIEVQSVFSEVIGLAWKPDGSLSVFTVKGDVYLISGYEIQRCFETSSMQLVKDKQDRGSVIPVSSNNILRPKPELVAKGIVGTCFNWESNYSLLYLDNYGNACRWSPGKSEKIEDSTGYFCYLSRSPFDGVNNPEALNASSATNYGYPSVITGTSNALEGAETRICRDFGLDESIISFGPIRTIWLDKHSRDEFSVRLNMWTPLQFALVENKTNLNDITDPSRWEYLSQQERRVSSYKGSSPKSAKMHQEIKSNPDVLMPINTILILRLNDSYLAIKPLSLGLKYKSLEDIPESQRKFWGKEIARGEIPPVHNSLSFEWKYWPKVTSQKEVLVRNKSDERDWKISSIPVDKEFRIGGAKLSWANREKSPQVIGWKTKFTLNFALDESNLNNPVSYATENSLTDVSNPSRYKFKEDKFKGENSFPGMGWIYNFILVIKIGDDEYIAIEPIEERRGWVQYKWKYWPKTPPMQEALAKTALN